MARADFTVSSSVGGSAMAGENYANFNNSLTQRSGTLIDLAVAYVQLRQIEQACDAASQADTLARQTESARNRNRLRQLLVDLLPWTNLDCVQCLYRQVLLN